MHWRHFLWVSGCKESCVQYLWAIVDFAIGLVIFVS